MTSKTVEASEFKLVDSNGTERAFLIANSDEVVLQMMSLAGDEKLSVKVKNNGLSSISMLDHIDGSERVSISANDKGLHCQLLGEGQQATYLFLKNDGASGLVIIDKDGNRKSQTIIDADGQIQI